MKVNKREFKSSFVLTMVSISEFHILVDVVPYSFVVLIWCSDANYVIDDY